MSETNFQNQYTDNDFWEKTKTYAKSAGETVLEPALKMYYSLQDADTPAWAKAIIISSLSYFILPLDVIPDAVPVAGYTDDLGVLVAAIAATAAHIKEEHSIKAKECMKNWFS